MIPFSIYIYIQYDYHNLNQFKEIIPFSIWALNILPIHHCGAPGTIFGLKREWTSLFALLGEVSWPYKVQKHMMSTLWKKTYSIELFWMQTTYRGWQTTTYETNKDTFFFRLKYLSTPPSMAEKSTIIDYKVEMTKWQ